MVQCYGSNCWDETYAAKPGDGGQRSSWYQNCTSHDGFGVVCERERKYMRRISGLVLTLLAVGLLVGGAARADQLYVCQSCNPPPGGDPNLITDTGAFNVGVSGNHTQDSPLLIIVAVYNGSGTPSISFGGNPSVPAATLGTYGLTSNSIGLTSGTVWAALGLIGGGSDSFGVLSGFDTAAGFAAPGSFTLDVFSVPAGLTTAGPITIDESGSALGSFILAQAEIQLPYPVHTAM